MGSGPAYHEDDPIPSRIPRTGVRGWVQVQPTTRTTHPLPNTTLAVKPGVLERACLRPGQNSEALLDNTCSFGRVFKNLLVS
jgi:hypothetical protein